MSAADRDRWNARHAAAPPHAPEAFVLESLPRLRALPPGVPRSALDVACGTGRHALLLAADGWDVLGLDVSEVAIERLLAGARERGLRVRGERLDLDEPGAWPSGSFGAVICTHFLHRPSWPRLREAVAPGGLLIFQTFTAAHAARTGFPRAYCLDDGELLGELGGFEILEHEIAGAPDREVESVIARRP